MRGEGCLGGWSAQARSKQIQRTPRVAHGSRIQAGPTSRILRDPKRVSNHARRRTKDLGPYQAAGQNDHRRIAVPMIPDVLICVRISTVRHVNVE